MNETKQTLASHINELRVRAIKVFLALFVGLGIGWAMQDFVIASILKPAGDQTFIYTAPTGGFQLVFQSSLLIGLLFATPIIILQIAQFIAPIMTLKNNRLIYSITIYSSLLALAGACFAYFFSLPLALHFLSDFAGEYVTTLLSVDTYLSFALLYIGGYALIFQIPLLLYVAGRSTPLPPRSLLKQERWVLIGSFIVGAVLTPTPDMVNQLILAGPIVILYQFGIIFAWLGTKHSAKRSSTQKNYVYQAPQRPTVPQRVSSAPVPIQPLPRAQRPPQRRVVMDIYRASARPTNLRIATE